MGKKLTKIKKNYEGELSFQSLDTLRAGFKMEPQDDIRSAQIIELTNDIFPADFDLSRFNVSGSYVLQINIEEKKPTSYRGKPIK